MSTKHFRVASALAMAVVLMVSALAPAAGAQIDRDRGRNRPSRPMRPPVVAPEPPPAPEPEPADTVDAAFVEMMIPHHYQALVMSRMAPARSSNPEVLALAERIDVEQGVEISMLQNWQGWNGLAVTDAEMAYEMMLGMPHHVEHMGMATPAELAALQSSSGTAFDRMYLELMIEHHEGALAMLTNVLVNGSDQTLQFWATDMMTAQNTQVWQMQQMLDNIT